MIDYRLTPDHFKMHIFINIIQAPQEHLARRLTQMLFLNADSVFVLLADTNYRGLVTFDFQLPLTIKGWTICLQLSCGIF